MMDRFIDALSQIEGGYALVALTNKKLIGARDPLGIRPLVLGEIDGRYVLASETCALDTIGARFVRDVEHGEVVMIDDGGVESIRPFPAAKARPCLFEYVYFSRPDSVVNGRSVYQVRKRMGAKLAEETHVGADIVVPVPDSACPPPSAMRSGAVCASKWASSAATIWAAPSSSRPRRARTRRAHEAQPQQGCAGGQAVVLIDDSIVRGTTSVKIVRMVREAGAKEVHLRSASPPIMWPDFYGIDMPDRDNLLAATHSMDQMREHLEVDSLGFLSVDGLYWAMEAGPRDPVCPQFTDHYFTGDYPTRLLDREIAEGRNAPVERQLSLLSA